MIQQLALITLLSCLRSSFITVPIRSVRLISNLILFLRVLFHVLDNIIFKHSRCSDNVICWTTEELEFDSQHGQENIPFFAVSRLVWGPTQPTIWRGQKALSPWAKRPAIEAYHSRPSSTEAKKAWGYTHTTPYVFMALWLIKHRDYTFTFHVNPFCFPFSPFR